MVQLVYGYGGNQWLEWNVIAPDDSTILKDTFCQGKNCHTGTIASPGISAVRLIYETINFYSDNDTVIGLATIKGELVEYRL